jgi:hypothetical protein
LVHRKLLSVREVWQGALFWCRIQLSLHFSGLSHWMAFLKHFRTSI